MKKTITTLIIIASIIGCAEEQKVDLKMGEYIWKTNCVLCHGHDGKLSVNGAKDLALSKMKVEDRMIIIRDGKNQMVPFKSLLSEEKIKAVANYSLKFSNVKE